MVMWKVTVAPDENRDAWTTYVQQAVIGIGWPSRGSDNHPTVQRFQRIEVEHWVVAHVPPTHGGASCLAKGVGQIIGPYSEVLSNLLPPGDNWQGAFRRQYAVRWTLGDHSLRGILNQAQYRPAVVLLSAAQE